MKKLKLRAMELGAKEILTREQLRKIVGGGTCQGITTGPEGNGSGWINTGLSYSQASGGGYNHWCCDSCCSASWADHSGC